MQWNNWIFRLWKILQFNRYTVDEKSSLHIWRGVLAPFCFAQLLSAINIFESGIYRKQLFLKLKNILKGDWSWLEKLQSSELEVKARLKMNLYILYLLFQIILDSGQLKHK